MRLPALIILALAASPAAACGPDSDCEVGGRTYRLHVSEADGPKGAILFAHGYRGSAAGTMNKAGLRALADELGMAFVALDSEGDDWQIAHTPQAPGRAEVLEYDYVDDVLDDLARRIDLDPARVVATGFSAGGMMTWTLACGMSEPFAGFIPMSGTFWAPVPETCTTPPANLVHIHGTTDPVVPITGRPIGETRQADVTEALAMYGAFGDFSPEGSVAAPGGMTCETAGSEDGLILDFCTFDGGHSFSAKRLRHGIARVLGND